MYREDRLKLLTDPQLGAIPYMLSYPNEIKHPTIYRSTRCMKCHASQEFGSPSLLLSNSCHGGGTIDSFRKIVLFEIRLKIDLVDGTSRDIILFQLVGQPDRGYVK